QLGCALSLVRRIIVRHFVPRSGSSSMRLNTAYKGARWRDYATGRRQKLGQGQESGRSRGEARGKTPEGARYEIAIDGTPHTYRDREDYAREAATFLKAK